jgi:hypothetical protein
MSSISSSLSSITASLLSAVVDVSSANSMLKICSIDQTFSAALSTFLAKKEEEHHQAIPSTG